MPETKTKDWVTPVVIVLGAVGITTGLYIALRKPLGISPGKSFQATFKFDYLGEGGTYILQVHLGKIYLGGIFDHVEGLGWSKEVLLAGPDSYEFSFECTLPMGTASKTYDGEAGIRLPGPWDPPYDYIAGPIYKEGAVQVRKET